MSAEDMYKVCVGAWIRSSLLSSENSSTCEAGLKLVRRLYKDADIATIERVRVLLVVFDIDA